MIFSHVLYQLSYPGIAAAAVEQTGERWERRLWRAGARLSRAIVLQGSSSSSSRGGAESGWAGPGTA